MFVGVLCKCVLGMCVCVECLSVPVGVISVDKITYDVLR